jgi:hypothetical protein
MERKMQRRRRSAEKCGGPGRIATEIRAADLIALLSKLSKAPTRHRRDPPRKSRQGGHTMPFSPVIQILLCDDLSNRNHNSIVSKPTFDTSTLSQKRSVSFQSGRSFVS